MSVVNVVREETVAKYYKESDLSPGVPSFVYLCSVTIFHCVMIRG